MSIAKKLQEYLDKENISYSHSQHETAYTAQEVAGVQHVPGKEFVKSVLVKADGKSLLCVLSANHMIDFDKLKATLNSREVELADEAEIAALFPDYEIGAMPPFGHLHNLEVLVDRALEEDENIVFNAGTHTDVIMIKFQDFTRVTKPKISDFGIHV